MNPRQSYHKAELNRVQKAKDDARRDGREVLTPLAAMDLFKKSPEAIRKAVRTGRVTAEFDLWVTDKKVSMIDLRSAVNYWGGDGSDLDDRLDQMRENGLTFAYGHSDRWLTFNILHPDPLIRFRDGREAE